MLISQVDIALIVTEVIHLAGAGLIDVGVIIKIEAGVDELHTGDAGLAMWIEPGQDASVFSDGIVDAPDIGNTVRMDIVVMRGPAVV